MDLQRAKKVGWENRGADSFPSIRMSLIYGETMKQRKQEITSIFVSLLNN